MVVACAFPPCEYKTKVACNMQRHVLRYHEPKKVSAPTPEEQKEPVRLPNGMFNCPVCTCKSRMHSNITYHIAVHSEVMPFVCKKAGCDYRFWEKEGEAGAESGRTRLHCPVGAVHRGKGSESL